MSFLRDYIFGRSSGKQIFHSQIWSFDADKDFLLRRNSYDWVMTQNRWHSYEYVVSMCVNEYSRTRHEHFFKDESTSGSSEKNGESLNPQKLKNADQFL